MADTFPMPPGTISQGTKSPSLTPTEIQALLQAGWRDGQPIPPQVEVMRKLEELEASRALLPEDIPAVRQTEHITVDLSKLDPAARQRVLQAAKTGSAGPSLTQAEIAKLQNKVAPRAELPPELAAIMPVSFDPLPQSVNPSNYPKDYKPPAGAAKRGFLDSRVEIVNDVEAEEPIAAEEPATEPEIVATPPAATPPEVAVVPEAEPEMTTGAEAAMQYCPHCNWDLSVPAIPEPSDADKQTFLQSILGLKPFIKVYSILGDRASLTFRALTIAEIDKIFQQMDIERRQGLVKTVEDYHEKLNRYRLYLQLTVTRSNFIDSFAKTLPDGYSSKTNPSATACWTENDAIDSTELPRIEEYFRSTVLPTESLQRVATLLCNQFNRLSAKLEVMVDNPDFWSETEPQS